jgi:hypothetical protein
MKFSASSIAFTSWTALSMRVVTLLNIPSAAEAITMHQGVEVACP